jgi:hypothetical protein
LVATYYCLEGIGLGGPPRECKDVRCDTCPNRLKFIPKKPTAEDAGYDGFPDAIRHPLHYARWKMEPIEFIASNDLPWWLANVIKYTMRYDYKDGLQDLYKARSYLDMKIRTLEGHERFWEKPVAEERKLTSRCGEFPG